VAILPDRGTAHSLQLLRRSRDTLLGHVSGAPLTRDEAALLDRMVANYGIAETHWTELESDFEIYPQTLLHGDFVIKNLRIQNGLAEPVLLVFDWEMAGLGVPAADLAQFVGGCVSPDLQVYWSALCAEQQRMALESSDIQKLANYGNLLRIINAIHWATTKIGGEPEECLVTALAWFKELEPRLSAALRGLKWN
jgi:hypothetical protein